LEEYVARSGSDGRTQTEKGMVTMVKRIEPNRLLIEERNRISAELHDRVSQHLYGVVYAIHALRSEWNRMGEDEKLQRLLEIQEAAATASRELRAAVFRLSSHPKGTTSWIESVKSFLDSQAKLYGVRIRFRAPLADCPLSARHQDALYRIIAEGVGNATRHGSCSVVNVRLTLEPGKVKLSIADDGIGFDIRKARADGADAGFGIRNMRALAASMGGEFEILSKKGSGTRLRVWLPLTGEYEAAGQNPKVG